MEIGEQRPTYDKVLWMSRQSARYKIDENAHLEQCQLNVSKSPCMFRPASIVYKYNPKKSYNKDDSFQFMQGYIETYYLQVFFTLT